MAPLVNEHWSSSSGSSDSSILTPEQLFRHMRRELAHWSYHSSAHFYTPLPPPCRPRQGKESCVTVMSWINWENFSCCVTINWSDSLRSVVAKRLNWLAYTFLLFAKITLTNNLYWLFSYLTLGNVIHCKKFNKILNKIDKWLVIFVWGMQVIFIPMTFNSCPSSLKNLKLFKYFIKILLLWG